MPGETDVHQAFRDYRNTAVALSVSLLAIVGAGVYRTLQIRLQPEYEPFRVTVFFLLLLLAVPCLGLQYANTQGYKWFAQWAHSAANVATIGDSVFAREEVIKLKNTQRDQWRNSNWWFDWIEFAMDSIAVLGCLSALMYVAIEIISLCTAHPVLVPK